MVCHFSELKLILLSVKSGKTLTSTAFYLKNSSRGDVILELIEIGYQFCSIVQLAIRIIGTKLRKSLVITRQNIILSFFRAEINFQSTIAAQQLSQDSFLL